MSFLNIHTPGLSYYSIPVVWLTALYPMNARFNLIDKYIGFNNLTPRQNTRRVVNNPRIAPDVAARIERLEGAHLNGNEVLPIWIAAVIAGNQAGLSQKTLNIASVAFIAMRMLYNYVYINHSTTAISWVRTGIFYSGLGLPFYLIIQAGNAIRVNRTI